MSRFENDDSPAHRPHDQQDWEALLSSCTTDITKWIVCLMADDIATWPPGSMEDPYRELRLGFALFLADNLNLPEDERPEIQPPPPRFKVG